MSKVKPSIRAFRSVTPATRLRELTCRMESDSVTCHPADVTFLTDTSEIRD